MNFNLLTGTGPNIEQAVSPVYSIVSTVLPILLGIVFLVGTFRCIALGIAFAKSDENGSHEKAKKDLIFACIGFFLIFVLIAVMYGLKAPLIEWLEGLTNWDFNS